MSGSVTTPEQVVAEAFRALEGERWEDFVELVEPAAVERFRDRMVTSWKAERMRPQLTAEDIRRSVPDMPLSVAEYHAAQDRRHREREAGMSPFGVRSDEEIDRLSAPEVLIGYLRAWSPQSRLWAELQGRGRELSEAQKAAVRSGFPRREVVGAVLEGESLAYVVYRSVAGSGQAIETGRPFGVVQVTIARRTQAGWRLASVDALLGARMFSVDDVRVSPTGEPGQADASDGGSD